MAVYFGFGSVWQLLAAIVCFALVGATAANTDEIERMLGQAVADALHAAHISIKEAATCMKLDEAQFRRQLRAEPSQQLSLTRLIRLPFSVWLFFGPSLIQIVYRKRLEEFAESVQDLKRGV